MLADREAYWRRKLGRLRLGAEPIEDQLARLRRALAAMTGVLLGVGSMILAIFGSFGRLDVGSIVAAMVVMPVALSAWIGHARLRSRARAYLREMSAR